MQKAAEQQDSYRARLRSAMLLIEEAIDILDLAKAPDDVAAHLDLGRHRLQAHLDLEDQSTL